MISCDLMRSRLRQPSPTANTAPPAANTLQHVPPHAHVPTPGMPPTPLMWLPMSQSGARPVLPMLLPMSQSATGTALQPPMHDIAGGLPASPGIVKAAEELTAVANQSMQMQTPFLRPAEPSAHSAVPYAAEWSLSLTLDSRSSTRPGVSTFRSCSSSRRTRRR